MQTIDIKIKMLDLHIEIWINIQSQFKCSINKIWLDQYDSDDMSQRQINASINSHIAADIHNNSIS